MISLREFEISKKKLMKLLLKKIWNNKLIIYFRNILDIKPIIFNFNDLKEPISVSDAFCWRTDNDFKTIKFYFNNFY